MMVKYKTMPQCTQHLNFNNILVSRSSNKILFSQITFSGGGLNISAKETDTNRRKPKGIKNKFMCIFYVCVYFWYLHIHMHIFICIKKINLTYNEVATVVWVGRKKQNDWINFLDVKYLKNEYVLYM